MIGNVYKKKVSEKAPEIVSRSNAYMNNGVKLQLKDYKVNDLFICSATSNSGTIAADGGSYDSFVEPIGTDYYGTLYSSIYTSDNSNHNTTYFYKLKLITDDGKLYYTNNYSDFKVGYVVIRFEKKMPYCKYRGKASNTKNLSLSKNDIMILNKALNCKYSISSGLSSLDLIYQYQSIGYPTKKASMYVYKARENCAVTIDDKSSSWSMEIGVAAFGWQDV